MLMRTTTTITTADHMVAQNRREFLKGGAAFIGGASLAGAAAYVTSKEDAGSPDVTAWGGDVLPFHGEHQSGVETLPQAFSSFQAFDLRPGVDREAVGRLMRLWTDDAARLTEGAAALADDEPELAQNPARLTVTFGFGPTLFGTLGLERERPAGLTEIPSLAIDRLQPRWTGGDLLVQIAADDPLAMSHATRMLAKDGRSFVTPRWVQRGFRDARGAVPVGSTPRNLLGQVDGTINPTPGTTDFADVVWSTDDMPWFRGGTTVVIRRIAMDVDAWDGIDRSSREQVIGRQLSDGAPLTGGSDHTPVDLQAVGPDGLTVIAPFAHTRRAHAHEPTERFLRRSYNYDDSPGNHSVSDVGLIFCAYQADIERQFLPVQQRLARFDLLNKWTTPVGSAVFALPPGCQPGGWIGQQLLG